ncbi:MAG: hypothetical protein H6R15_3219 [Proteobacteria bacterium]|nr:hypothetical protein [Pseudomonadota bacterium]
MGDFISLSQQIDHPAQLLLGMAAVVVAYALFTLVGFGSALLASPPLALLMPVARVIPLLALLDFAGSSLRGWRARQELAWPELRSLLPGMLAGQLFGVLVLARLPANWMALGLGFFVVVLGLRGLFAGPAKARAPAGPALLYGLFGGVLGGLFGSGGFVYASYLERRLASRTAFRATQAVLIALSTGWRIILCFSIGLIDWRLLATTLAFLPAMAIGVYFGHRLDLRLGREQLFRLLNGLLLASGLSLVLRFAG